MSNVNDFITHACKCLYKGKSGTFALMRDPSGQLWYLSRGTQSKVLSLSLSYPGCTMDENSFQGTLIIRSDSDKEDPLYVLLDDMKALSYVVSSNEKDMFFSCSIVAEAPQISGCTTEPIAAIVCFSKDGNAVVRFNSLQLARALFIKAHHEAENRQLPQAIPASENTASPNRIDESSFFREEDDDYELA